MTKTSSAFQTWSTVAAAVRAVALLVLLTFIYLFVDNKALPTGTGTVTPLMVLWKLVVPLVPVLLDGNSRSSKNGRLAGRHGCCFKSSFVIYHFGWNFGFDCGVAAARLVNI